MLGLEGRTAVITGAGRGIGAALARVLAADGCHVVLAARTAAEVESVAAEICAAGGRAIAVAADVGSPAGVDLVAQAAGDVDVLINNAGRLLPLGEIWTVAPDDFLAVLQTNVGSAMFCLRAFMPGMRARGWGRILGISSDWAHKSLVQTSPYSASKAAFERLHAIAAEECRDVPGIKINWAMPGGTESRMFDHLEASGTRLSPLVPKLRAGGSLRAAHETAAALAGLVAAGQEESGRLYDVNVLLGGKPQI